MRQKNLPIQDFFKVSSSNYSHSQNNEVCQISLQKPCVWLPCWCKIILYLIAGRRPRLWWSHILTKGSQTRGPRAKCGPPKARQNRQNKKFWSTTDKKWSNMAKFCTKYGIFFTLWPYSEMRPAETFSIQMWPVNGFEFETPVLT